MRNIGPTPNYRAKNIIFIAFIINVITNINVIITLFLAVFSIFISLYRKYDITWKDIEVLNDETGRPYIKLSEQFANKIEDIDISISHCKEYAVANVVIIERED